MDRELEVDRYEEGPGYEEDQYLTEEEEILEEKKDAIVDAWALAEEAFLWDNIEKLGKVNARGSNLAKKVKAWAVYLEKNLKPLLEELEELANE